MLMRPTVDQCRVGLASRQGGDHEEQWAGIVGADCMNGITLANLPFVDHRVGVRDLWGACRAPGCLSCI
jgi:hypothetical protein